LILIAYDGSDDANESLDRAAALFPGESAVVLTVWQRFIDTMARSGTMIGAPTLVDLDEIDGAASTAAKDRADAGAARARELGLQAHGATVVLSTTTGRAIIHEAGVHDARAIVMGSRGLTGLKSVLLGSVSHDVLNHADRPVVVVPSPKIAKARAEHLREP
jgi:nucleotide-binding universal stress UspA family protein